MLCHDFVQTKDLSFEDFIQPSKERSFVTLCDSLTESRHTAYLSYALFVKMSIARGGYIEFLKQICMDCTKNGHAIRELSHLAKSGKLWYIIARKGDRKESTFLYPRTGNRSRQTWGARCRPKITGGRQPLCSSHIREYRKTIKNVRWRNRSRWRGSVPKFEEREVTRMLDTKNSKK